MNPEYFVVDSDEEELCEYEQLRKRNIEEIRKKLSEHMANQPKFPAVPTRQPGPVRKAKKKVKKVKRPTPIFQCFIVLKDIGKNMPTTVGEEESLQRIQEKAKRRLDNDDDDDDEDDDDEFDARVQRIYLALKAKFRHGLLKKK